MSEYWQYDWYLLGAVVLLALCSVITRAGYFLFGDHIPLPDSVRRALRYAPVAALIAIIIPELLPWAQGETPVIGIEIVAAAAAVLVYVRTRSTLMVIVSGMLVLWLLQAIFS
ncbi:MAG TPA: AzlD domain-containing protein [Paenalcaligenes sp.]|nr:AzlD domain-containing protein [Paenalcaligenes sp.]